METNNYQKNKELQDDELDLFELYKNVLAGKFYIFLITLIFAIGSVSYSLSLPDKYTATSLLSAVQKSGQTESGSKGGLNSILSLAGGSTGSGNRANLALAIIQSRDFFDHIISKENVLAKLVSSQSYDPETKQLVFNENIFNKDTNKWNISISEAYSEVYRKDLSASLNPKTGFIALSFSHISPEFAYQFIELIIQEVNFLARSKDIKEASDAMEYLEQDLGQYSQVGIQAAIGQLIESQLKTKMLANVRANYLLDPIDSPTLPDMKSTPYRTKIVLIGTLLGFAVSLIFVIALVYAFGYKIRK